MNELVLALKYTGYSSMGCDIHLLRFDWIVWFLYDKLMTLGVMTAEKEVYESYFNEILQRQTFFVQENVLRR